MMQMIPKTPLHAYSVKVNTVSPLLSGLSVKSSGLARGVLTCERRECSFATAVNKLTLRILLRISCDTMIKNFAVLCFYNVLQ